MKAACGCIIKAVTNNGWGYRPTPGKEGFPVHRNTNIGNEGAGLGILRKGVDPENLKWEGSRNFPLFEGVGGGGMP